MIIMKFGGTSVGTAAAIRQVGGIVRSARETGPVVVVVSALSGVTDLLIHAAEQARDRTRPVQVLMDGLRMRHLEVIAGLGLEPAVLLEPLTPLSEVLSGVFYLRELTARTRDFVLSAGETTSSLIVAAHLRSLGLAAEAMTGWDAGIVTDDAHGAANVLDETWRRVPERLGDVTASIPVVTGFLGGSLGGERTTLGRGGSDYSAAILGRALGADEIQIWTDVDGILTTDPRIVPEAFRLEEISFQEAAELAYFGAKVIHPKTIEPAVAAGIPVRVLNTFNPTCSGTRIVGGRREVDQPISALSVKKNNTILALDSTRMLNAEGYLARVFEVLQRHRISVDAIATSEVSVCMTVEARYAERLEAAAVELRSVAQVELRPGRATICAVGQGMRDRMGTAARIFAAVREAGVNVEMISMGSSRINITFAVKDEHADAVVRTLHRAMITEG